MEITGLAWMVAWLAAPFIAWTMARKRGRGPIRWTIATVILGPWVLLALMAPGNTV